MSAEDLKYTEAQLFQYLQERGLNSTIDTVRLIQSNVARVNTPANIERLRTHYGLYNEKADRIDQVIIGLSLLGVFPERECIDREVQHRVNTISGRQNSALVIYGEVYAKPGEKYTADLVSFQEWTNDYGEKGIYKTGVGVVADGAKMLIPVDYLSEVAPEMVELCTINNGDESSFRPDVFWRMMLGAILGDMSMSIPEEFLQHPRVMHALEEAQATTLGEFLHNFSPEFSTPEVAQRVLTQYINPRLRMFLEQVFDGYNPDTFHRYPSGVLALMLMRDRLDNTFGLADNRYLNGFAVTGDIGIAISNEYLLGSGNDTNIVNNHDNARYLAGWGNTGDPHDKDVIARYRVPFTGNFPVYDNVLQLMQSIKGGPISSGNLWKLDYTYGDVVAAAYTDGMIRSGTDLSGITLRDRRIGQYDDIGLDLSRDFQLSIAETVANSVIYPRKPDDIGCLVIGNRRSVCTENLTKRVI